MRYKLKDVFTELANVRGDYFILPARSAEVDITNKNITIFSKRPFKENEIDKLKQYLSDTYTKNINSISVYQSPLLNNKNFDQWINSAINNFNTDMANGNSQIWPNKLLFKLQGTSNNNSISELADEAKPVSATEKAIQKNNINLVSTKKLADTSQDGEKQIEYLTYNRNVDKQILNIFETSINPKTEIIIKPSKRQLRQIKSRNYKIEHNEEDEEIEAIYADVEEQLKANDDKNITEEMTIEDVQKLNEQEEAIELVEEQELSLPNKIRKIIQTITNNDYISSIVRMRRNQLNIKLVVKNNLNYETKIINNIKSIINNKKVNIDIIQKKEEKNNEETSRSKAMGEDVFSNTRRSNADQQLPIGNEQSGATEKNSYESQGTMVESNQSDSKDAKYTVSSESSTSRIERRNDQTKDLNLPITSENQGNTSEVKSAVIDFNSYDSMINGLQDILQEYIPNHFNIFKDRYELIVQGKLLYNQYIKQLVGNLVLVTERHVIPEQIINGLKKELYNKLNGSKLSIGLNNHGRRNRHMAFNVGFSVPSSLEKQLYPHEKLLVGNNFIMTDDNTITNLKEHYNLHDEQLAPQPDEVFQMTFENFIDDSPREFISQKGTPCISCSFLAKDEYDQVITVKYLTWEARNDEEKKSKIISNLKSLKHNDLLAVSGNIEYNTYSHEVAISVIPGTNHGIKLLKPYKFEDNSNCNGRYDLNVHTKMSALNSINNPKEIFDKAAHDGMGGIAITDDFSVQNFTSGVKAQNKYKDFKPIFGVELNTIADKPTFVYNPNNIDFWNLDTEYVAFDIETTGFSDVRDDIIELSAVKYKLVPRKDDGKEHVSKLTSTKIEVNNDLPLLEITDSLHQLVKTDKKLRDNIVDLTGITNEQLDKEGISVIDALNNFVDFIGDKNKTILIGQNVIFDIDFINEKLRKYNIKCNKLQHEIIDTLPIARHILPGKRSYSLTNLASYLNIKLTRAHHAISDAETTGFVGHDLLAYLSESHEYKINNGFDLQEQEKLDDNFYKEQRFANKVSALIKDKSGIKNLYRLISEGLTYTFGNGAKLYENVLLKNRQGLLISSGGPGSLIWEKLSNKTYQITKEYAEKMNFDYFEIAPLEAYDNQEDLGLSGYKRNLSLLIKLAKELNKPLVVVSNSHYTNKDDYLAYDILKRPLLRKGQKSLKTPFLTTNELLDYFTEMLDGDNLLAKEIVIDNTVKIGQSIAGDLTPIITKVNAPEIENAEETLRNETWNTAKKLYGDPLPDLVKDRLQTELDFIIKGGYTAHYLTAQKLVKYSNSLGYIVGSRGSVGSSAVAFMVGITEVNALPPHYRSKHGDYLEWADVNKYQDGFDLPKKEDPNHPGEWLIRDGHNLPFATFLGLHGTKVPDIDLNMASDVQSKIQLELKNIFGENHTIRVGTIQTVAEKTALGYVFNYARDNNIEFTPAEITYYANKIAGTFKSTGQHPAGIMIVPKSKDILDFTPFQYPANKPGEWKITHFTKDDMHDALLKMDVLGHDDPSMLYQLEKLTGVDPHTIDVTDPKIIALFENQDTAGIPEFNTKFAQEVLKIAKPHTFNDLVQISGLSHGTNVWEGNAKDLIEKQGKTLADVIGSRDKIMQDLLAHDIDMTTADKVVQMVKKRIPFDKDMIKLFKDHGIEDWYIESLKKIEYLYPAAHAIAYVMSALRIAYYKVYYPREFYATLLSYRLKQYNYKVLISNNLELVQQSANKLLERQNELSVREKEELKLYTMLEATLKAGFKFKKPSLHIADSKMFLLDPNDDKSIIVPLCAISGLGKIVPQNIVDYRNSHNGKLPNNTKDFKNKQAGCGVTKACIETLVKYNIIQYGEVDEEKSTKKTPEYKIIYN